MDCWNRTKYKPIGSYVFKTIQFLLLEPNRTELIFFVWFGSVKTEPFTYPRGYLDSIIDLIKNVLLPKNQYYAQ